MLYGVIERKDFVFPTSDLIAYRIKCCCGKVKIFELNHIGSFCGLPTISLMELDPTLIDDDIKHLIVDYKEPDKNEFKEFCISVKEAELSTCGGYKYPTECTFST